MLRRLSMILGLALSLSLPAPAAHAALTVQPDNRVVPAAGADDIEAHQYKLPEARVPGADSVRQTVTAWEVTGGSWNGEKLGGLSLVLVKSVADNLDGAETTNCYVSHLATPAQRSALVSAFLASQSMKSAEARDWRLEPAVIRVEIMGKIVIVHVGLVA